VPLSSYPSSCLWWGKFLKIISTCIIFELKSSYE